MEIICHKKYFMKKIDLESIYVPTDDFFKFAYEFSKNFELLSVGTYKSDNDQYQIEYSKNIDDIHSVDAILRIGVKTGIINISKSRLLRDKIKPFGVLFLIIWGNVYFNVKNRIVADEISIRYLESLNFPMTDVFKALQKMLTNSEDKTRLRVATNTILEIKDKRYGNK